MTPSLVICIPSLSGQVSAATLASVANLSPGPEYLEKLQRLSTAVSLQCERHSREGNGLLSRETAQLAELAQRALPFHIADTWAIPHNIVTTRSRAVRNFLQRTTATHLLFVDADVAFTLETIRGMLTCSVDLIGAPYPKRGFRNGDPGDLEYVYSNRTKRIVDPDAVMSEVDGLGMGCTLISRELLVKMWKRFGERSIEFPEREDLRVWDEHPTDGGDLVLLFALQWGEHPFKPDKRTCFSEDLSFCNRAKLFTKPYLYLGPGAPAAHMGEYMFRGDKASLLAFMRRG